MKSKLKQAASAGIIGEVLYFISLMLFLTTHTEAALTFWEGMTVAGAFILLIVLAVIAEEYRITAFLRRLMLLSLSGTTLLTAVAHITSIGVIRPLAAQGTDIPEYCKIGVFPSLEMTLDYIAWGLFMGLAFIVLFLGIREKAVRFLSLCCGLLCLIGFAGSFFSEALWYAAPMGYGVGFLILCIFILTQKGEQAHERDRTQT